MFIADGTTANGRKQSSRINLRPAAAFHKMDEIGRLKSIKQGFLE